MSAAPTRRTVVRGAAWSVPVVAIASAAPAYAASPPPCQVGTHWNSMTTGTRPSRVTFPPTDVTMTLSYSGDTGNQNGSVLDGPQGGQSGKWLLLEMDSPRLGDEVTATLTFSEPVENLTLTIFDIDAVDRGYIDSVVVTSRTGMTYTSGSGVQGTGTTADPFRPRQYGDNPSSSLTNNVDLTWQGPIRSVSFTYRARLDLGASSGSRNQRVGISDINFTKCT